MGKVESYLQEHLHSLAGPYLFAGAGLSRRYASLDNWKGLLTRFANRTDHPFEYYRGAAGDDYPKIASMIADAFYDRWWTDASFTESVQDWSESVTNRSSPLKYEIAKYTQGAITDLKIPVSLRDEYEKFRSITVDGIITTNYDRLIDHTFPDFHVYVGQDELLFSDIQGIAEIYHIHGSDTEPNSLVLTDQDYQDYTDRNAYLAAKLATIFVEHPVVFIGYSLGDPNIQSLLSSLIRGLREENTSKLQDRLIFVEWNPHTEPDIATTVMNVNGVSLPILRATVPDFSEIFSALSARERAMPARILRTLKEQVFELVRNNDPDGRLVAVRNIEDDQNTSDIDVVFGVGAKMTAVGIVGLSRWDIVDDVLASPERALPAALIVSKALPRQASSTYVPVFKYVTEAGLWVNGRWKSKVTVNSSVRRRVEDYRDRFTKLPTQPILYAMAEIEKSFGKEGILKRAMELPAMTSDVAGLRDFLIREKPMRTQSWWSTQYAKAAVAYDWLRYGAGVRPATE